MAKVPIKTCDLLGPPLDWAVAIGLGLEESDNPHIIAEATAGTRSPVVFIGPQATVGISSLEFCGSYRPSFDWGQGGPLIEKVYRIEVIGEKWEATIRISDQEGSVSFDSCTAETPLIAACRVIVTASLGTVINVPDSLIL